MLDNHALTPRTGTDADEEEDGNLRGPQGFKRKGRSGKRGSSRSYEGRHKGDLGVTRGLGFKPLQNENHTEAEATNVKMKSRTWANRRGGGRA